MCICISFILYTCMKAHLPAGSTVHTEGKRGHRLISTTSLCLQYSDTAIVNYWNALHDPLQLDPQLNPKYTS